MINLSAVVVLLQMALSFLGSSIGTPNQDQALSFANQAILLAQQSVSVQVSTQPVVIPQAPVIIPITPPQQPVSSQNQAPQPQTQQVEQNQAQQQTMDTIEIFSPVAGQGIGRRVDEQTGADVGYRVSPTYPEIQNSSNYIILGLIYRNSGGKAIIKYDLNVTATDSTQNKTINGIGTEQTGVGNIRKIYRNGVAETVSYYEYVYNFPSTGTHTITFTINGLETSVELEVN